MSKQESPEVGKQYKYGHRDGGPEMVTVIANDGGPAGITIRDSRGNEISGVSAGQLSDIQS
jgi:hypothetical protein